MPRAFHQPHPPSHRPADPCQHPAAPASLHTESSTLFIAIVTTVLVGSLTAPMLKALGIEGEVSTGEPMSPRDWEDYAQLQNRVEEEEAIWTVKTMWRNIDSRFMKPIFGGRGHDRRGERSQGARLLDDVRQPSTQSNGP